MIYVQLPNGNDAPLADADVLHYHGIRDSKLALDAVVSGLFDASRPRSPEAALSCVEKTKFEKYWEAVRSRPEIRFIPFAPTEFGALNCNATVFFTKPVMQASAS
jgi:hypothetical protein